MFHFCNDCLTTPTDHTHRVPVVPELPLTMQAYQVVDNCGPTGITNPVSESKCVIQDKKNTSLKFITKCI